MPRVLLAFALSYAITLALDVFVSFFLVVSAGPSISDGEQGVVRVGVTSLGLFGLGTAAFVAASWGAELRTVWKVLLAVLHLLLGLGSAALVLVFSVILLNR